MKKVLLLLCTVSLFLSVACTNEDKDKIQESKIDFININHQENLNQENSNKAKEILNQHDYVTKISVVNNDREIVASVNVTPFNRFKLKKIEKELQKKLKEQFPHEKVTLSTDQKIMIELQEIEKSMQKNHMTKKQLNNKISHIKKLSKEQT